MPIEPKKVSGKQFGAVHKHRKSRYYKHTYHAILHNTDTGDTRVLLRPFKRATEASAYGAQVAARFMAIDEVRANEMLRLVLEEKAQKKEEEEDDDDVRSEDS